MQPEVNEERMLGILANLSYPSIRKAFPDMSDEELGAHAISFVRKGLAEIHVWECLECGTDLYSFTLAGAEIPDNLCDRCGSGAMRWVPVGEERI